MIWLGIGDADGMCHITGTYHLFTIIESGDRRRKQRKLFPLMTLHLTVPIYMYVVPSIGHSPTEFLRIYHHHRMFLYLDYYWNIGYFEIVECDICYVAFGMP